MIMDFTNRKHMFGETALLLLLQKWIFPCKHVHLMHIFGIHYSTISLGLKFLVSHLVTTFTPLLTDNLDFFVTRFPLYRECINRAHAAHGNQAPVSLANVVAFVNAILIAINRPGGNLQQAVYSGKNKSHSLKSQGSYHFELFLIYHKVLYLCRSKLSRRIDRSFYSSCRWSSTRYASFQGEQCEQYVSRCSNQ